MIAMDPFVLQALLGYTDGIQLTTVPVDADRRRTPPQFLLQDQYAVAQDNPTRIDALEEAAQKTFTALLGRCASRSRRARPRPRDRWPATAACSCGRRTPAEQDLLRRVGLLGAIPPRDGGDGWSFTVNNAGGNKIDTYLAARCDLHVDRPTGDRRDDRRRCASSSPTRPRDAGCPTT